MSIFPKRPAAFPAARALLVLACLLSVFPGSLSAQSRVDAREKPSANCAPFGRWTTPGGASISEADVISRAAGRSVVLLGEMHDNADHHRWQLQTLAALHAVHPDMVIGFEMFPRRVQKALDQWVAGDLSESQFLAASEWNTVWSTDAGLYMPLFQFARMNRIPMVALNIDTRLRRAVAAKGLNGVPENEREGVTTPAAPSQAYLDYLLPIYAEHEREGKKKGEALKDDKDFRRFVEAQQLWDRAMAQALHSALNRPDKPLVVGIMGSGHIKYGFGVPHQLKDLKVTEVGTLLPWSAGSCDQLGAGIADAIFGTASVAAVTNEPPPQRLGIRFEIGQEGGARVLQVERGSIAETAGLRDSDLISEAAGVQIRRLDDIVNIVKRQAPGTWLPLKIKRGAETLELVAKFPPLQK